MNIRPQLKLFAVFALVVGAGLYFVIVPQLNRSKTVAVVPDALFGWKFPTDRSPSKTISIGFSPPTDRNLFDFEIAYSSIRDPGGIPQGLPVRLKIPVIGVDSAIEDAFITPDGRMDVPAGSVNVAWFALGPQPGRVGSSVIGGHYGIRNGVPFVFYKLDKLVIGDKIYVENDKGVTLGFVVRSIRLFERTDDATTVFTSSDGLAHLNVITCEGIWNSVNGLYPQRRVVFTDAIGPESIVPVATLAPSAGAAPATPATFARILRLGMRGADVVALQTALEQKGFLVIPRGYVKGYYGTLTRTAVSTYQKSVGLPVNGVFGLTTRVKLVSDLAVVTAFLPTTALTPSPSTIPIPITPDRGSRTVKNAFATPKDSIITSVLLLAIAFVAFKIIRLLRRA